MKKLFIILLLLLFSNTAMALSNAIKMGYNFVTISQTVVFNSAMQSGGTLTLSATIADGGGRNPGDPLTLKLVFYNSSNQIINTTQAAYTLVLGAAATTYSVTATNCGGSCASVSYVSIQFYGKDGGYWAGNYGPYIQDPVLSHNGGFNILYNSEFGIYTSTNYPNGWASSNGWQSCQLYSGTNTCVINNGALVNGGYYSATGGTTSGQAGGYGGGGSVYTSNITSGQQINITTNRNRTDSINNGNEIYIDQIGNNNTTTITQSGNYNKVTGTTNQTATISGNSNNTTIRQNSGIGKNLIDLNVSGTGNNTLNLNQGYGTDGTISSNQLGNNYQKIDVQGSYNTITTQQTRDVGTVGNYMEQSVSGNYNSITSTQSGDSKLLFNSITGNNNTVSTTQSGTGAQHYIDLTLNGNGNSATVNQSGNTQNKATIVINNIGGSAGVDLTQTGGQTYNITTNCVTLGGCGTTTVRQGQ
jgi:hypothetical protein